MNCSIHLRIVNHRRKWAAVEVPRCGCTTLKMVAARDNLPLSVGLPEPEFIHKFLDYLTDASGGIVVPASEFDRDGYTRFAVWRDPVQRMASLWKRFCGKDDPWMHAFCGAVSSGLVGSSWQEFCEYVKWVHSAPSCAVDCSDHHLARQVDIYGRDDVDAVVRLEDLSAFLVSLGSRECLVSNQSPVVDDAVDDNGLRDLLAADYEILEWGKTWVPDVQYEING